MVREAGDDRRATGRALLMQFTDAGDADVRSSGRVDVGARGPHQRQPHRVAPQQYQAHVGLVYLDLEPEHVTQERGSGRKIVNLQVGPAAQELSHRNMLRPRGRESRQRSSCRCGLGAICADGPSSGGRQRAGGGWGVVAEADRHPGEDLAV